MKRLLFASIYALVLTPLCHAADSKAAENKKAWDSLCTSYASLGKQVMLNRQQGVSMIKQMQAAEAMDSPELRQGMKALVQDAYKTSRMEAPSNQRKAAQDFEDQLYGACLNMKK